MSRLLKGAAGLVLVTGVVWVAVLWYWDSSRRNIGVADIVIDLAVLPLVVFGLLLGLRWAWQGAGPRREAALAAIAAATAARAARPDPTDSTAAGVGEAQRHAPVCLLAAHVACNAGTTPAAVLAAIGAGAIRPELDAELRDADGLAVMAGRVADLQPEAIDDALSPILARLRADRTEWAAAEVDDPVRRALALLEEPLGSALRSLTPWGSNFGVAEDDAVRMPREAPDSHSMVRWLLGWPAGWSEFEREAANEWARSQIAAQSDIALDRFALVAPAVWTGEELWLQADALLQTLARERRSDLVLVTACDSALGDSVIAALEQQQRLFSALRCPKGLMAGEGAAALLLANPDWPAPPRADPADPRPARLHHAVSLRRDTAIDTAHRASSRSLEDCATHALATARLEPGAIAALVSDADQHTPRGAELYGATLGLLPQLDASEDMHLLGVASGHVGIVGPLLVVALAGECARAGAAPCLALCLGDAHQRLALVARPPEASTTADPA